MCSSARSFPAEPTAATASRSPSSQGWQPAERTLGIVGVGHVGSLVKAYAEGWGFRVVCCDPPREEREQVSLDAIGEAEVLDALRRAQPDTMSPIEAMQLLYDLKKKLPN